VHSYDFLEFVGCLWALELAWHIRVRLALFQKKLAMRIFALQTCYINKLALRTRATEF